MLLPPGITAEDFISRPKVGPDPTDYGQSKYDLFQEALAKKLNIPQSNVDIFTVMNHPTQSKTIDVRYSAHGSPYYRPARLDGILLHNKVEVCCASNHSYSSSYMYLISSVFIKIIYVQFFTYICIYVCIITLNSYCLLGTSRKHLPDK